MKQTMKFLLILSYHNCPDDKTTLESIKVVDCSPEELETICREHEKLSDACAGNDSYYILETRILPSLMTSCNDYLQYLKDTYGESFNVEFDDNQ